MTTVSGSRAQVVGRDVEISVPQSCVVFTPRPLADAMVQALGDQPHSDWLEPCVGAGVFLEALSAAKVAPSRIRGLDVGRAPASQDRLARMIRGKDFLQWSLGTAERFSQVVANPPYIALNRMPTDIQGAALNILVPGSAKRVKLGANAWFAFLCASIGLLKRRGSLAFLLPAAWEYADYAAPLRISIRRLFETVTVHRCRQPLFKTVHEGSVVLVARGFHASPSTGAAPTIRRISYKTPERLIDGLASSRPPSRTGRGQVIDISTALSALPSTHTPQTLESSSAPATAKSEKLLGDVIQLRLGGVTGDAAYFVLSEGQRIERGLPCAALRPIVSRARHLTAGEITEDNWKQLRDDGERVWLFDPTPAQAEDPAVKRYLDLARADGGCDRLGLKVRSRDPWFRTPIQRRIDGFMSGMSGWGPWVVFREMPRLAATNTLYLIQFLEGETQDEQAAWAMWLLTSGAVKNLRRIGRQYAEGLVKFEPGDIADLPIGIPTESRGAYSAYQRAVRLLLKGQKAAARREADQWF